MCAYQPCKCSTCRMSMQNYKLRYQDFFLDISLFCVISVDIGLNYFSKRPHRNVFNVKPKMKQNPPQRNFNVKMI